MNRRKFLQQLAAGAVAITAYSHFGPTTAFGGSRKRRALINIIKVGGTDSFSHHSAFAPSQLRNNLFSSTAANGSQLPFVQADSDRNSGFNVYTVREPENSAQFYTATNGGTHYFGSSIQALFRDRRLDNGQPLLSKMSIWKGISSSCRHESDNPIILHGVASSYALSFSALVAARLARDSARTLHYAVLHSSPSEAHLNFAMNTGYSSPSCIPGVRGLASLTGTDPFDFNSVTRRNLVSETIKTISGKVMADQLKLKSSLQSLKVFFNSLVSGSIVAGTHLDEDVELLYARYRFRASVFEQLNNYFHSDRLQTPMDNLGGGPASASGAAYFAAFNAGLDAFRARPAPTRADMDAYRALSPADQAASPLRARLATALTDSRVNSMYADLIDRFALSGYLVRKDLSAVVDFRDGSGQNIIDDAHFWYLPGLIKEMVFYTCYQELMLYLDEVKNVNDGETLLDATHIVMHTEMDRSPWIQQHSFTGGGTNHSLYSTSVVMAGYGIHGGRVIGDLHKGVNDSARFPLGPSYYFTSALPIDLDTGVPKPSGTLVSIKSIAPTILSMFDTALPSNQISDENAVPAVVKKDMT